MSAMPGKPDSARAGMGRRLFAAAMGTAGAGFGVLSVSPAPAECRYLAWLSATLFVPVGCWLVFLSIRGRDADLREFSVRNAAHQFVGKVVGGVVIATVFGLLWVLRRAG